MSADTGNIVVFCKRSGVAYGGILQNRENFTDPNKEARFQCAQYYTNPERLRLRTDVELKLARYSSLEEALADIPTYQAAWKEAYGVVEYEDPLIVELDLDNEDVREMRPTGYA